MVELVPRRFLSVVTNLQNTIKVNKRDRHFVINNQFDTKKFELQFDAHVMEKIDSIMGFCFHGMGLGAMRYTETGRLDM